MSSFLSFDLGIGNFEDEMEISTTRKQQRGLVNAVNQKR